MWRDAIKLVTFDSYVNDVGDVIDNKSERTVFANKLSIGQKEHYEAMKNGLKPEIKFEIRSVEYKGEEEVKHSDKSYKIIRTYDKGEFIELICQGLVS